MSLRQSNWERAGNKKFDVAILGTGINGTSIYKKLCEDGYKVLMIDKNDFSCGTSQASAMMIWGGILYLKNLDFFSVYRFSRDRDKMIENFSSQITPQFFRYLPSRNSGRNKGFIYFALYLYWLLGFFNRKRPFFQKHFEEAEFTEQGSALGSFVYEEGFIRQSDNRFTLDWILDDQTEEAMALNYCQLQSCTFNSRDKEWSLHLQDSREEREIDVKAKVILNCAGVWTDSINDRYGIQSPYKHVFSKGVFIGYQRPESHRYPLIFEMGQHGDTLTFIPWGPISLWGPTETIVRDIDEGYRASDSDVTFLIEHAKKNLKLPPNNSKISSLRCGIRPLAVDRSFATDCYPLDLSRRSKIAIDRETPWISVYGGKISGCISLAKKIHKHVSMMVTPTALAVQRGTASKAEPDLISFPGLDKPVPSLEWCMQNEFCCTLEDYLRRRTNISQWIPREGLGFHNENYSYLLALCSKLNRSPYSQGKKMLHQYVDNVSERFDKVIEKIDR